MPSVLRSGDALAESDYLESPDKRFQFHVLGTKSGGDRTRLVLYAFTPQVRTILWQSRGHKFNSFFVNNAYMGRDGTLRLRNGVEELEAFPSMILKQSQCSSGSFLSMTNDGRWMILAPDGKRCTERPDKLPDTKGTVIPNVPTVLVPVGSLAVPGTTSIMNDTDQTVGVSDGTDHRTLFPGGKVDIQSVTGALILSLTTYTYDQSGTGDLEKWVPPTTFKSGTTIKVTSIPGGKFTLA